MHSNEFCQIGNGRRERDTSRAPPSYKEKKVKVPTTRACAQTSGRAKKVRSPSPHKVYRSAHRAYAAFANPLRSDLKPARTSSERSWGCSNAAKWQPLSSLLYLMSLGYAR